MTYKKFAVWLAIFISVAFLSKDSFAATFTVTNTNDAGIGSLRQAVLDANADAVDDVIDLSGVSGTITLTTGLITITKPVTISGPGAATLAVSGAGLSRIFLINNLGAVFTVSISGLTLSNGKAKNGALINVENGATLHLSSSSLKNGVATGRGGAIDNSSILTVENCTFSNNSGPRAGAIFNALSLTVANSTFSGNSATAGNGGAIENAGANARTLIQNSTILGNSAVKPGGALRNTGSLTVSNSIIANSTAGGNCSGVITSGGNNIDSANTCAFTGPGDLSNTDPLIGSLADNGGQTQTFVLLAGSPAIDAGNFASCSTTDQRGFSAPLDGDGDGVAICDIGAVEVGCGNGFLETTEQCDDGNASNTDACLNTCVPAVCGDGFVQAGVEGCDDGNVNNSDACLNSCVSATCGDGIVQVGVEECDNGTSNSSTSPNACRLNCINPVCGDKVADAGEACDDGNAENTDACLNTCLTAACGDSFVEAGVEECDNGANNSDINSDACRMDCTNPIQPIISSEGSNAQGEGESNGGGESSGGETNTSGGDTNTANADEINTSSTDAGGCSLFQHTDETAGTVTFFAIVFILILFTVIRYNRKPSRY